MRFKNDYFYTFLTPFMISIALIGFVLRNENKKLFYLPLLTIGSYLIIEKDINRRLKRKNILKKIKFFKENK